MPLSKNLRSFKQRSLSLIGLLLVVAGCSSVHPYPEHELAEKILKPRKGYKGLTNRYCENQPKGECKWVIKEYLLEDEAFRKTANDLDFVCSIGGHRYKICKDQPGFCHKEVVKCGWFKRCVTWDYKPVSNYQYLLDAKTTCANRKVYPFQSGLQ